MVLPVGGDPSSAPATGPPVMAMEVAESPADTQSAGVVGWPTESDVGATAWRPPSGDDSPPREEEELATETGADATAFLSAASGEGDSPDPKRHKLGTPSPGSSDAAALLGDSAAFAASAGIDEESQGGHLPPLSPAESTRSTVSRCSVWGLDPDDPPRVTQFESEDAAMAARLKRDWGDASPRPLRDDRGGLYTTEPVGSQTSDSKGEASSSFRVISNFPKYHPSIRRNIRREFRDCVRREFGGDPRDLSPDTLRSFALVWAYDRGCKDFTPISEIVGAESDGA